MVFFVLPFSVETDQLCVHQHQQPLPSRLAQPLFGKITIKVNDIPTPSWELTKRGILEQISLQTHRFLNNLQKHQYRLHHKVLHIDSSFIMFQSIEIQPQFLIHPNRNFSLNSLYVPFLFNSFSFLQFFLPCFIQFCDQFFRCLQDKNKHTLRTCTKAWLSLVA